MWIKVPNCFPEWLYHFTFPWGTYERAGGSKFLVFFMLAILTGVCWDLTMFLGYISLIVKILYIFSCAYLSSIYLPWWNCLLKTFVHFPIGLFLTVDIREFLIYSGYKTIVGYVICEDFLPNYGLFLHPLQQGHSQDKSF